ncbi:MAG: hypothetical protein J0J06_02730 [Sphingomonas sp.]|nr:hypothetical protein [Sphingomonas sp.]
MGVQEHASIGGAVANSALVIVAAARDAAVEIARSAADHVEPDSWYLDMSGCASRDAAAVDRALGDLVRLSLHDRNLLVDRARTIPFGLTLEEVARHLVAGSATSVVPAYAGAQVLPFALAARAARRLPSVRAA